MLAATITLQGFETIAGRHTKVTELLRIIEHVELSCGQFGDRPQVLRQFIAAEKSLGVPASEALNHKLYLVCIAHKGKRAGGSSGIAALRIIYRRSAQNR